MTSKKAPVFNSIKLGSPSSKKLLILLAGYPDSELSGWGEVIPELAKDYRLFCLCYPGFSSKSGTGTADSLPKWGYTWKELLAGLNNTIEDLLQSEQKQHQANYQSFTLVTHDWGAHIGLVYQNQFPKRVDKLVLLDVGMLKTPKPLQLLVIILYQLWFATSYLLSQLISQTFGSVFFNLFVGTPLLKWVGPCPHDLTLTNTRNPQEIHVNMCYLYYHFWRALIIRKDSLPKPKFPTCPVLFLYGTRKRCLFHDERFLNKIERTEGCAYKAMETGHWIPLFDPKGVVRELRTFMSADRSKL